MKMSGFGKGLNLFIYSAMAAYCQQGLTNAANVVPALKTLEIALVERAGVVPAEHHYVFHLDDVLRDRFVEVSVDRSACRGKLLLNDAVVEAGDITTMVRFDRENRISVGECLERTPAPIRVTAWPKVHIAKVSARANGEKWDLDVVVRNTLLNSATCALTAGGYEEDFFVGPETSQTRSFSVRLRKRSEVSLVLELHKFEEAIEGAYRHLYMVELPRKAP